MKVLCKKNLFDIFNKDKWYDVRCTECYDDNDIYCYEIEGYFLYNDKNIDYFPGNTKFSEYFYTTQELRKDKLQKLNDTIYSISKP